MSTKAGIWLRVSTGGQDEANQRPDLERWCADHGYEVTRRYELNDRSAYHGEQETAQGQALADMRAGRISVLVVWASDRIERRGAEATLRVFRQFAEAGGRLESVQEPWLANPETAELLTAITGWKDRAESARKAGRTRLSRERTRAEGGLYGRPPWGYAAGDGPKYAKRLVPTRLGREYAPQIWQRYAAGDSLREICAWLEAEGVATASRALRWHEKALGDLLRNTTYIGLRKDGQGRIVARCEGIVDPVLFRRVGKRLDERPTRRGKFGGETALLTSVLFCGTCGSPMYRSWSGPPGKRRRDRYSCKRQGCSTAVSLPWLDAKIDDVLSSWHDELDDWQLAGGEDHSGEREAIRAELRALPDQGLDYEAEDRRRAELRAALDAIPADTEGTWQRVKTGVLWSDVWNDAASEPERRRLMADRGLRITFRWPDGVRVRERDPEHARITLEAGGGKPVKGCGFVRQNVGT